MRNETDRQLVELAQRGTPAAIGELFARYWRAARAAAFGVTGDIASAEDAAAEAFIEALTRIQSLRDPDRFGAWLRTIVVRGARRNDGRRHAPLETAESREAPGETPDRAYERRELVVLVHEAVRDLPDALREAVALVYFEGYDSDAAAMFLDIPAGTLRRRLHDGRLHLRRSVEHRLDSHASARDERQQRIERTLARLATDDDIYKVVREALALRPMPRRLLHALLRRRREATTVSDPAAGAPGAAPLGEMARDVATPSSRVSDPLHAVGGAAAAIEDALAHFQPWPLEPDDAARFLTMAIDHDARVPAHLPPGFAEGRPGAYKRRSRALLFVNADGSTFSLFEHLQRSPDERAFRDASSRARLSDAIDLLWMVAGPLDLHAVQELLDRVCPLSCPTSPFASLRTTSLATGLRCSFILVA